MFNVIIPVRNDAGGLQRCLNSIRDADGEQVVTIMVGDNGSEDESAAVGSLFGAEVYDLPGLRVSALRNRLAAAANGEYLAFIDADHVISTGWFVAAQETLLEHDDVAAVGASYHPPIPSTWVQTVYDGLRCHPDQNEDAPWLGSGNLVVRSCVFQALGGFDEQLESCEDVDFCLRLREAGHRLLHVPVMYSTHYGDPESLRELLNSEMWRGRDNLRVSLSHHVGVRDLPSIVMPIVVVMALALVPVSILLAWIGFPWVLAIPLGLFALVVSARTILMRTRLVARVRMSWLRLMAVAATYEFARAMGVVVHRRHRRAALPTMLRARR